MVSNMNDQNAASLVGLFSQPIQPPTNQNQNDRKHALLVDDDDAQPCTPNGSNLPRPSPADEQTPLMLLDHCQSSSFRSLFDASSSIQGKMTPKTSGSRKPRIPSIIPDLPAIHEIPISFSGGNTGKNRTQSNVSSNQSFISQIQSTMRVVAIECASPSTWIGGCMFLLFHIVFALTFGATITRPHSNTSMLGLMTKMASLGIIFGSPVYWISLRDVPALYPTVDLFSAPFLAKIALIVDQELYDDPNVTEVENDQMFLATFTLLATISLVISGSLLVLASIFKVANLGAFLPYPVLCGFFSAVGVLMWTLAFKVDSNGIPIEYVLVSGDTNLFLHSCLHHAPSFITAAFMKYLSPKNNFFTVAMVGLVIVLFYVFMLVFHVTMEEMIENRWFWSTNDLNYVPIYKPVGLEAWTSPMPFGWINAMIGGKVCWSAVSKGVETSLALAFLYLIRCALHGAALKKTVPNLTRVEKIKDEPLTRLPLSRITSARTPTSRHRRVFSEAVDIEQVQPEVGKNASSNGTDATRVVSAKASNASLKDMLMQYGYAQYVGGLVGSFAVTPCVASAPTMYTLGAERLGPQLLSVLLLSIFYLTNFELVNYIPKPAFSSLLVLAFFDMTDNWFIQSYHKTEEKAEWLVVPIIVVLAFVVGLLKAVLLGIAMATFLFVGAFNRSGVVKYVATGMNIRSTIERPRNVSKWLDRSSNQIQILVLQNYLFFGNASSLLSYITSMFEEIEDPDVDPILIPPFPKIVVLDLTLVTGIDTSAVDAFSDILIICGKHDCKLFLAGVSSTLRKVMSHCGIKPENIADRSLRKLRFFGTLDEAIGKAEDLLLKMAPYEVDPTPSDVRDTGAGGFRHALIKIDEEHDTSFCGDLIDIEEYTKIIDLQPGDLLYENQNLERGLFFIEFGLLKMERTSDGTVSRGVGNTFQQLFSHNQGTLSQTTAQSIGMAMAQMKSDGTDSNNLSTFRVARVGPGWILGSIEALGGASLTGNTEAVTPCRLHYISFSHIQEIELSKPILVLKLYKLLSYLMAKRHELTISQLGTLHSIMSAPARKKPISRSSSRSFIGGR